MREVLARAVVAGALVGVLCGCTGSGDEPPASSSPPATEPTADDLTVGKIQPPPELEKGWQGILQDVTVTSCPTAAGRVTAKGEVINSAEEARDISIVIAWNAPGSTRSLMQLAVTKPNVPAGKTVRWKASSELPSDSGPCVVLARSGRLASG